MTELLVLDYNRPTELLNLLKSLRKNCLFEHRIVVLNNGGDRYASEFLENGLCDKVIHNNVNCGGGLATIQLFAQCETEFAFYIQVDHELICLISDDHLKEFERKIAAEKFFYVDLAGRQCGDKYSERAHFIRKEDYFRANISAGGVGPMSDLKWTEESLQDFMAANKLCFYSVYYKINNQIFPPFLDCGQWSVRENPDSSQWKHRPSTKELWLIKGPVKEKFNYPKLNDEEWDEVLKTQSWPDGKIPFDEIQSSFKVKGWDY